jgi:hypothetical protein
VRAAGAASSRPPPARWQGGRRGCPQANNARKAARRKDLNQLELWAATLVRELQGAGGATGSCKGCGEGPRLARLSRLGKDLEGRTQP